MVFQNLPEALGNLESEIGRDSVAHLNVLLGTRALEEVVVREGLQTRRFSHGEAATLARVGVDEIMTVLRNVDL